MDSENHTAHMGFTIMWAEMLRCTVHDIAAGIRIGALDDALMPQHMEFQSDKARQRDDAHDAVNFLRSPAALKICEIFRAEPAWLLRKCMEYSGRKGVRGKLVAARPPANTDSRRKPKRRREPA